MSEHILKGLVLVNGKDIWEEYGVFLCEEKRGGRENLTALLKPSKAKGHVGVDMREQNGVKYSTILNVKSEEREVTLHFAQVANTRIEWMTKYKAFMELLKTGAGGWLNFTFSELGLEMKMYYMEATEYKPLTALWNEGLQASRYKVKFKEPNPSF